MKNNIEIIKNARADWHCTLSDETIYNIREALAKKVAKDMKERRKAEAAMAAGE